MPELDRPSPKPAAPALISDTEAHAVWQRAAELQANTGLQPRPDPLSRPRDASKDRSRSTGFGVDDVRSAANEAGISDRYVQHALIEHGLAPGRPTAQPERTNVPAARSWWAGAPLELAREIEIDGEMSAREFEGLINIVRDHTGRLGKASAKTRELAWASGGLGNRFEVSVVPDQGHTTIRLSRSTRRIAAMTIATSVAVIGGVGGSLASMTLEALLRLPAPDWGLALRRGTIGDIAVTVGVAVAVMISVPIGRAVVRRVTKAREARLRALADALASKVRESIG